VKKKFLSLINKKVPEEEEMTQNYFLKIKPTKQKAGFGAILSNLSSNCVAAENDSFEEIKRISRNPQNKKYYWWLFII
jgi:hypothetical protein